MPNYREPGVSIRETITPQITPLVQGPADICLVGLSAGFQTRTDRFILHNVDATKLPGLPTNATLSSVLEVKNIDTQRVYTLTTDYTVQTAGGTITAVATGAITAPTAVSVTYRYVPVDYWTPRRCFDLSDVESRFGGAFAPRGGSLVLNSPVSLAASIAFENGAPSVVIQPLFVRATPGDTNSAQSQPNDTQAAATSTWSDTLRVIRELESINVIVPVVGQSMPNVGDATQLAILQEVLNHNRFMRDNQQYIMLLAGEDSSGTNKVSKAILRTHAATLASQAGPLAEQCVLVSPTSFRRFLPDGTSSALGGQYMAAAIGGMLASRPVSTALTRRAVGSFAEILDPRIHNDKQEDAAVGLLVVENRRGIMQIRHGTTLDVTGGSARREISVVRAKHRMIESVRETLDRQVIGILIADQNAPLAVSAAIEGVLADLLQNREIVAFSQIASRYVSFDPTTIQVRFSYRPAFPVNYIDIEFSIDLSAGTVGTTAP